MPQPLWTVPGGLWRLSSCVVGTLHRRDAPTLAAAVAYYALLSVFPLLLLGSVLAASFLDQAGVQAAFRGVLTTYLPPEAAGAVHQAVVDARVRRPVGMAGLLLLLWSGSAATGAFRHALHRVLQVKLGRPLWRRKLADMAATLLLGALLAGSLSAAVARALLARLAPRLAAQLDSSLPELEVLGRLAPPVLSFSVFLLADRILPAQRMPRRALLGGAAVATLLFELARGLTFGALEAFPGSSRCMVPWPAPSCSPYGCTQLPSSGSWGPR